MFNKLNYLQTKMRKFYSLVLMAAGLLIGTNAWATLYVNGELSEYPNDLQQTINSVAANDSATITLEGADLELSSAVIIQDGRKICLDLNDNEISDAGTGCFELVKGTLHIKNGTINHKTAGTASNVAKSAITVFGAPWEHKTEVWSTLIVDENATISTVSAASQYGITVDAFTAHPALKDEVGYTTSYQNQASKPSDKCAVKNSSNKWDSGCAFGVRILIKGGALVYGYQRGINVAGNINSTPDCDGASSLYPYIKIYKDAEVKCYDGGSTASLSSGNGGIYAAGYAVMDISGYVHGQTGILVKSGDITLTDATIISDGQAVKNDGNYKGNVAGTAIFITSDAGYAGNIDVTIEGSTTVQGGANAAIVDVYASNSTGTSNVDNIDINGGKIVGGNQGAIIITDKTADKTDVYVAEIDGTITVNNENVTNDATLGGLIPGTTTSTQNYNDDKDYILDVKPADQTETGKPEIEVKPNTSKVITMNADGWTTFSAGVARQITNPGFDNTTLSVYYASSTGETQDVTTDEELTLTPISGGVIPANTGVIFKGNPGQTYVLGTSEGAAGLSNNLLKPATAWSAEEPANGYIAGEEHNYVYVLVGDELYKYEGTKMKVNKAYLELTSQATPAGAPKRIKLVITETEEAQAVDNVETETVKAVKFVGADGQLYIRRGETIYTIQGQVVK